MMEGDYVPGIVLEGVFRMLGGRDLWAAAQTCRRWRSFGRSARPDLETLVVSDFYKDVFDEERFIEFPVFQHREDLAGLTLIRSQYVRWFIKWLGEIYPNVTQLVFRNYVRRGPNPPDRPYMRHQSRFHVFVISEVTKLIEQIWPDLEMLDVSGEVVDIPALNRVKKWPKFKELRLSGSDLSCNMIKAKHTVTESLYKIFWTHPLSALRMSNLDCMFDMTFKQMTFFKALKNESLMPGWLKDFFNEAVNLKSLSLDCRYMHDEHVLLIGNLPKLELLALRNCRHVNDFSPLADLSSLHRLTIDLGDKGTEEQLCKIVQASRKWRQLIFNHVAEPVGDTFLITLAEHCAEFGCPLTELQLNTEKNYYPYCREDVSLRKMTAEGVEAVIRSCPWLETFGLRSPAIDDECLLTVAEYCPRIHKLIISDSSVTNDGVLRFGEVLRQNRYDKYFGEDCLGVWIDVRGSQCTKMLISESFEEFGTQLKVIL